MIKKSVVEVQIADSDFDWLTVNYNKLFLAKI